MKSLWRSILNRLILASHLLCISGICAAQENSFTGEWLLWIESAWGWEPFEFLVGPVEENPAYANLVFEETQDGLSVFVNGGPVNLLELDGSEITFDIDWTDLLDQVHVSVLKGVLENSVIRGSATDNGADIGTWHATPIPQRDTSTLAADPVDLVGIWAVAPVLMKYSYDLTEAGQMADDAYDPTIDDSALRCVSDGLIRMSLGPFKIEVLEREGRIIVLYEDMHEVRRLYTDGRSFPEGIENANLSMGYSIGHWEDDTLVIETRGLKKATWDAAGMPISSTALVNERWYLDETGQLHIEYSLLDSVNYNRPVLMHQVRPKEPDDAQMFEYSCDPHAFYRSLQLEGRWEQYWERMRSSGVR